MPSQAQLLTWSSPFCPPQLLYYTQNVRFTTSAQEEIFFTREREMLTTFDIQNIKVLEAQRGQKGTVGHFNFRAPAGKELEIQEAAVTWAGGGSQVRSQSPSCTLANGGLCCMDLTWLRGGQEASTPLRVFRKGGF